MMTNRTRGVLYIGMTNDHERRVCEHQNRTVKGFIKQYKQSASCITKTMAMFAPITREKIKGWRREKKSDLVRTRNPK